MMNTVYRKYGRQFPRIQLPDVNTRRHGHPTIKNCPTFEIIGVRGKKLPNVRQALVDTIPC